MSEPIRLLASPDTTDLERQLLSSWNDEHPSEGAREKALAALGVTSSTIAAAGITIASVAPKAITAGWIAFAKWFVALSAIGLGVRFVMNRHAPATNVAAQSALQTPAPSATNVVEKPAPPIVQQNNSRVSQTHAVMPPMIVRDAHVVADSLNEQISALDHARTLLESGDAQGARKLADAYDSEYPSGSFTQEAEVVRIDAFMREGNRDAAARAGKHFLATYPKSAHAPRVRALLGTSRESPSATPQ